MPLDHEPVAVRAEASRRVVLGATALGVTSAVLPGAAQAASGGSPDPEAVPVLDADALAQLTAPTTAYPSNNLLLKNYSTTNHRICYVRFDLTGTSWVSAAAPELQLTTLQNNDNTGPDYLPTTFAVEVYGLEESASGYAWSETTLTWSTRPAAGALASGRYVPDGTAATLLGEMAVAATAPPDPCTLSGTTLRDFIRGLANPSVTFILIRKDVLNTNLAFYDGENGAAGGYEPVLTLG